MNLLWYSPTLFRVLQSVGTLVFWSMISRAGAFFLHVFVAFPLPSKFVFKDVCRLDWIHVSHKGSFLQFQFFQKADDNKKVVYTWSNTWFLRTNLVTSNGGNNPRLLWSSNELETSVGCKTLCTRQLVMTWVYGATSFQSLYSRWVMSISTFPKDHHHYLLMKRSGGREREAENINLGHTVNPLLWAHPPCTHISPVRLSNSPDISFRGAWRVLRLLIDLRLSSVSCFPNGSSWHTLIPGSGALYSFSSSCSIFKPLLWSIYFTCSVTLEFILSIFTAVTLVKAIIVPTSSLIYLGKGLPSSNQMQFWSCHLPA